MYIDWFVQVSGSCLDTLIIWQALFSTQVSRLVLLARMGLFAAEVVSGIATVRAHPKANNFNC